MDTKLLKNGMIISALATGIFVSIDVGFQPIILSAVIFANFFMGFLAVDETLLNINKHIKIPFAIVYLVIFDYFFLIELLPAAKGGY